MSTLSVRLYAHENHVQVLVIDPNFYEREEPAVTNKINSHYIDDTKYGTPRFGSCQEEVEWSRTQDKKCMRCESSKPLSCFPFNTVGTAAFRYGGVHYRRGDCNTCCKQTRKETSKARKNARSTKAPKDTPCEICNNVRPLVWDHDHDSLEFRGWICEPCNRGLGLLGDTVEKVNRALAYLKK